MDLSFKEKKTVCNFVVWFLKYQAKRKVVIFLGRPVLFLGAKAPLGLAHDKKKIGDGKV